MKLVVDYTYKADGYQNPPFDPKPTGVMVHSTATPGVMAQQFRNSWDRPNVGASVHAFVDDKEVVQCLPWTTRAGHAGDSANRTHLAFEMCEPSGFRYGDGATMIGYDPVKQQPYFDAVYKNAVELTAYLCKMFDLDPLEDGVVICHSEGYVRGVASNHADVMHWFPYHSKTMDMFRQDVAAEMKKEDEDMSYEKFLEMYKRAQDELDPFYAELKDVPDYWREEVKHMIEVGAIKGDGVHEVGKRASELKCLVGAARYTDNYFGVSEE